MNEKIQQLQILEQNLQSLMMQKQAFQIELNETIFSIDEMKKTNEDVYKIVGQIMLRSGKEEIEKELQHKKELLELRLKSIEKQEKNIQEKALKLKSEFSKKE